MYEDIMYDDVKYEDVMYEVHTYTRCQMVAISQMIEYV